MVLRECSGNLKERVQYGIEWIRKDSGREAGGALQDGEGGGYNRDILSQGVNTS